MEPESLGQMPSTMPRYVTPAKLLPPFNRIYLINFKQQGVFVDVPNTRKFRSALWHPLTQRSTLILGNFGDELCTQTFNLLALGASGIVQPFPWLGWPTVGCFANNFAGIGLDVPVNGIFGYLVLSSEVHETVWTT